MEWRDRSQKTAIVMLCKASVLHFSYQGHSQSQSSDARTSKQQLRGSAKPLPASPYEPPRLPPSITPSGRPQLRFRCSESGSLTMCSSEDLAPLDSTSGCILHHQAHRHRSPWIPSLHIYEWRLAPGRKWHAGVGQIITTTTGCWPKEDSGMLCWVETMAGPRQSSIRQVARQRARVALRARRGRKYAQHAQGC